MLSPFHKAAQLAKIVAWRVYSDVLMPSRMPIYAALLEHALDHGYKTHSVASFWKQITSGPIRTPDRCLILRHDVDTDPRTARVMWECEQHYSVTSSFYFRLSTLDPALMRDIHSYGSEASYHYEELATIAKSRGLRTSAEVMRHLPEIRGVFRRNVLHLREMLNLPMSTVASHGDFVNRHLHIPNTVILSDQTLRKELSIEVESYDYDLTRHFSARHSDRPYPEFWDGRHPTESLDNTEPVVHILTHPRQWRSAPALNMIDNLSRLHQGLVYHAASLMARKLLH